MLISFSLPTYIYTHTHTHTGGKIPGAVNVPSEEWGDDERIDALIEELKVCVWVERERMCVWVYMCIKRARHLGSPSLRFHLRKHTHTHKHTGPRIGRLSLHEKPSAWALL
jgi:hypothetical protein